ncbi:hypothetical protein BC941DRAFT_449245 [Chlamydoabsidia padenii]|nr:hypothetical protein BC941DRAFT_449245 [Chlamydoabsidia padenii]
MKEAPWSNHKTLDHPDKEERLSLEILQFEEYISPTEFERTSRQKAQHDFEVFISSCIPDAKAVAFGSHVTGLFLPGSDMDLNIRGGDQRAIARIRKGLLKQGMCRYHEITYIPQAKVPVISIDSPRYPITIDITANNPSPSSDRTILWLKQYPELRPLYFVLKHALLGLQAPRPTFQPMSSKFGGMASYTLVCLIVNFLKEEAANHGCDSDSTTYYANVLVDILHFYSTFDFANKGIRFTEGESPYFSKGKRPPMMIIDPDIPGKAKEEEAGNRYDY